MKKFLLINLLYLLTLMSIPNAQVRRIVLLEEATNTSCPPCAENNPKLQAFFKSHFGGIISVRYHAWWPGGNDPMYLLNPEENRNRIQNYYGIFSVPNYYMDGIDYGEPLDSLIMIDQMRYHLSMDSPVKIKVTADIDADSVRATLKLIGVSPVSQTQLKFRSAIIERMVQYSSPPGSNGETIFPDVFRKMLPDTNGYAIDNINPGEEITYYVSYPINPEWNWQDLAVVAWLQTDENWHIPGLFETVNNEIIQSNISIPTYIIQSDDPLAVFLSTNENYSKTLKIINDNDVNLHLWLNVTEMQVPAGWGYNFTYNNTGFDTLYITITPSDSVVFVLNVNTNSDPGIIRLALLAQNLDDPYNYGYTANYLGVTKPQNSDVLYIDDDGGGNLETFYLPVFDSIGVRYFCLERSLASALEDQILAEHFKAIFWGFSELSSPMSPMDISFLENYLESGGNLFIASSDYHLFGDLGWFWMEWNYDVLDFCHNFLNAECLDITWADSIIGIIGTLGEGISSHLEWGDPGICIGSYTGVSDEIFKFANTSTYGGISYDAGIYKSVLLSAGLENFTSSSARRSLIQRIVNWFDVPVGVSNEKNNIPDQYNLEQNYPNPFNSSTKIKYSIPQSSNVIIKVFDILGNEIETLVSEEKPVGIFEITWYADQLPSGVYFYRLKAGDFIQTRKMILLR